MLAVVSFAQAPGLTNPATQQLKNWLAAYDDSDWKIYLSFTQKTFASQPEPMFMYPPFRDLTGGFDLNKIEAETATRVTALIQERNTDQMARMVIEVETADPTEMDGSNQLVIRYGTSFPPEKMYVNRLNGVLADFRDFLFSPVMSEN